MQLKTQAAIRSIKPPQEIFKINEFASLTYFFFKQFVYKIFFDFEWCPFSFLQEHRSQKLTNRKEELAQDRTKCMVSFICFVVVWFMSDSMLS